MLVLLDVAVTADLKEEYLAREVITRVQKLRKTADLQQGDKVEVFWQVKKVAIAQDAKPPAAAAAAAAVKGGKKGGKDAAKPAEAAAAAAPAPISVDLAAAIAKNTAMIEAKVRAPLLTLLFALN